jgi:glyoxylase-like metal-dependent hydrolase (beta-lactamase superfamily II)
VKVIPLYDSAADVFLKASRGQGLTEAEVARRADVPLGSLRALREGQCDPTLLRRLALVLGLNADAWIDLARGAWRPDPVDVPGLAMFRTPYSDYEVNNFVVFDAAAGVAAVVDTGSDAGPVLAFLRERGLTLKLILLTHRHGDHVFAMDHLKEATGAPAFIGDREPLPGAEAFHEGRTFYLGALRIETRLTWGHLAGGITYVVRGLSRPVALVGDAVFAGSMGGALVSYADALRTARQEILSLPDAVVIAPGHGPLTTVGEEKRHNPFFAA